MDNVIWLALMIVFVMVEAATVCVVSLWFAGGALAALIAAMLGAQVWLQILLFLAVSAALLIGLRPWLQKFFTPKLTRTNVDAVIGKVGLVTAAIDNLHATGQVKLGGVEWAARSTDGQPIEVGARVRVDKVEGVKVFVTAVEVRVKA